MNERKYLANNRILYKVVILDVENTTILNFSFCILFIEIFIEMYYYYACIIGIKKSLVKFQEINFQRQIK